MAKQQDNFKDVNEIEITREMLEAVAEAQLYREDVEIALKNFVGKITSKELKSLYRRILQHPDLPTIKKEFIEVEEMTLVDDDVNTINLVYNKLLKKAQFDGKYDVVAKILDKIRQLKSIDNNEMEFKIIFEGDDLQE